MSALDTVASLAAEIGLALEPLAVILSTPDKTRDFLLLLGWQFDTPPPEVAALGPVVNAVVDFAVQDDGNVDVDSLLPAVAQAVAAIAELENSNTLPADFKSEFPRQLFDYLFVEYLFASRPGWAFLLWAIGIIQLVPQDLGGARVPFTRRVLALTDIQSLLSDPLGYLKTSYAWGTSDFDGRRLQFTLQGLLTSWGFAVERFAGRARRSCPNSIAARFLRRMTPAPLFIWP